MSVESKLLSRIKLKPLSAKKRNILLRFGKGTCDLVKFVTMHLQFNFAAVLAKPEMDFKVCVTKLRVVCNNAPELNRKRTHCLGSCVYYRVYYVLPRHTDNYVILGWLLGTFITVVARRDATHVCLF